MKALGSSLRATCIITSHDNVGYVRDSGISLCRSGYSPSISISIDANDSYVCAAIQWITLISLMGGCRCQVPGLHLDSRITATVLVCVLVYPSITGENLASTSRIFSQSRPT